MPQLRLKRIVLWRSRVRKRLLIVAQGDIGMYAPSFEVVQAKVNGNSIDPRVEVALQAKRGEGLIRAEKGLLMQILGILGIVHQT